jgi:hypothetical protein
MDNATSPCALFVLLGLWLGAAGSQKVSSAPVFVFVFGYLTLSLPIGVFFKEALFPVGIGSYTLILIPRPFIAWIRLAT